MARKSSSKKTASTNGDARTTNGNHIASKKNSTSALQTSSASESNASQAKAQHPSPVTGTTFYASVSEETIRHRAYELYMQRGGQDGGHVEDWFRAEAELRGRH